MSSNYIEHESNIDRNKTPIVDKYIYKIRTHLIDIIDFLKKFDTLRIQLTISKDFISSIDNDEECVMHSKRDDLEIMINDEADEVDSLQNRYQNNLELMEGNEIVFKFIYCIVNAIK